MSIKYAMHPGYRESVYDGDMHYIGYCQLINLYKVNINNCILWEGDWKERWLGREWDDYIHLYPDSTGNYKLAKEEA